MYNVYNGLSQVIVSNQKGESIKYTKGYVW